MSKHTKKTILIVEDEQVMLNLLKTRLEKLGFNILVAVNGSEALSHVRGVRPDLMLLDMMLPKLSGFGVLEKMKEEEILPELPVIIISNSGQPVEIDRALKLGVRDYLIKVNFDLNELLDKIRAVMGSEKTAVTAGSDSTTNVLIVEDDPFLIELLEKKFTKSGLKVFRATEPLTARIILDKERVDAILLDIVLPGADGISLLKEWKSKPKLRDIPVVITSNLGQAEEVERGMQAGAVGYIIKSNSTPAEIVTKVMKVLKLKS